MPRRPPPFIARLSAISMLEDHYLYLIDNYGQALRFNTIDFTMTNGFMGVEVNKFGTEDRDTYFLQCNKEVIRVSSTELIPYSHFCIHFCMYGFTKTAWSFYKYNFTKAAWEALDEDEIRGKSWFLSNCGAKFSSAAEGTPVKKVHFLTTCCFEKVTGRQSLLFGGGKIECLVSGN
ncbi:uncharacterized protein LOC131326894 [Rhododendron vialii]|uniref:uncharacterized protein LOC131326894 n=1 Tax=Rhododendron vialii TaxID=182163 RepID=UPI00265E7ABF|nr:uncharacterized protein LOC131326894 [Rhododendron vialii]